MNADQAEINLRADGIEGQRFFIALESPHQAAALLLRKPLA